MLKNFEKLLELFPCLSHKNVKPKNAEPIAIPSKIVVAALHDRFGQQVCNGATVTPNQYSEWHDFDKEKALAIKACSYALLGISVAGKTDAEVLEMMNSLIAERGYTMKLYYSGWKDTAASGHEPGRMA